MGAFASTGIPMRAVLGLLFGISVMLSFDARAAGACEVLPPASTTTYGQRIAAIACAEHTLWYRPFIDMDGRLASTNVSEAESSRLADGSTEPWRRVAMYWRDAGLDWRGSAMVDASTCAAPVTGGLAQSCRGTIVDNPWSAAFLSYVVSRAGVPGFRRSASHADYVAQAYQSPDSPYSFHDPASIAPATGDMLCFVRASSTTFGHAGLRAHFDGNNGGLAMHCDVVVGFDGKKSRAYLVGGNVLQGVTMRILPINRSGQFWSLPQRISSTACTPDNVEACSFNRQDWVALLKLRVGDQAAPPWIPSTPMMSTPRQDCCVNCVVGSGIPRCPVTPLQSPLSSG